MRNDYGKRNMKMGGGMMKRRPMMNKGGKLKMVMKGGKKVPFFAADGKGAKDLGKPKMMKGGRVKKNGRRNDEATYDEKWQTCNG